jgi:hypothetical protein
MLDNTARGPPPGVMRWTTRSLMFQPSERRIRRDSVIDSHNSRLAASLGCCGLACPFLTTIILIACRFLRDHFLQSPPHRPNWVRGVLSRPSSPTPPELSRSCSLESLPIGPK